MYITGRVMMLGAVLLAASTACAQRPSVRWSPAEIALTIAPNGFHTLVVEVWASAPVTGAALDTSPAIRPYVRVTPDTLAALRTEEPAYVRLEIAMPVSASPGAPVSGAVEARIGRRRLGAALQVTLQVVSSTPEGTLENLRAAIDARDAFWYGNQFVPERQQREREVFETLSEVSLDALSKALQTAERVSLSSDGLTAEYKIVLVLDRDRTETTLTLERGTDGIWRLLHF